MKAERFLWPVVLSGCCAFGQTVAQLAPNISDTAPNTEVWTANMGNDPVGPGDLLFVRVTGSPEMSRSYRVDAAGNIQLPLSQHPAHVGGLNSNQIAEVVVSDLKSEHILVAPIVSVAVLDYRSRQVTVTGAVKNPGVVEAVGNLTVLQALAKVQGLAPDAGPEMVLTRPGSNGEAEQVWHIAIKPLMAALTPDKDIVLRGGDQLRVLEAPKIFLVGNLKMPGIYPLNEVNGTTVLRALAMSQGQLSFTTKDAYIYRDVDGHRTEIPVPLRKILHRTAPDVALQANDILYVPEADGKHLAANVIDRLAGFGGSVGANAIIWH
jgi:polysaccharide export outer membrane protein